MRARGGDVHHGPAVGLELAHEGRLVQVARVALGEATLVEDERLAARRAGEQRLPGGEINGGGVPMQRHFKGGGGAGLGGAGGGDGGSGSEDGETGGDRGR